MTFTKAEVKQFRSFSLLDWELKTDEDRVEMQLENLNKAKEGRTYISCDSEHCPWNPTHEMLVAANADIIECKTLDGSVIYRFYSFL